MSSSSIPKRQKGSKAAVREASFHSVSDFNELCNLFSQKVTTSTDSPSIIEAVQLEQGTFQGKLVQICLGNNRLAFTSTNLAMRWRGELRQQYWHFFLFPEPTKGFFDCRPLNVENTLFCHPGGNFDGVMLSPSYSLTISLDQQQLEEMVRQLSRFGVNELLGRKSTLKEIPVRRLTSLRRLAGTILHLATEASATLQDARVVKFWEHALVETTARAIVAARNPQTVEARATSAYAEIVRLAEDYLHTHRDDPISVKELCDAVNVCERTLRNAFQTMLKVSPNTYLKIRRLHFARMELERPNDESKTVTSVALACGFSHLSYFARDYQRLFGEKPSETLAKSRSSELRFS